MRLIVEDGTGVAGANSLAGIQEAALFHSERGGLIPVLGVSGADIAFQPGGIITGPAGKFDGIEVQSIIEVSGAALAANSGFGHLRSVAGDQLAADWLETATELAGEDITITVYEKSGWWHPSSVRMEQSLVNATAFANRRYDWPGLPALDVQPLPWPRTDVIAGVGSPYLVAGYILPDGEIPLGVQRAIYWLSLADLEEPLLATVDPREALKSKKIGVQGIEKVYGGLVRKRRFPAADAEVAGIAVAAPIVGPFVPIEVV